MLMRLYTNLFFVTILCIGLLAPFNGFAKQTGLLPLTYYPPVLVQKMDSCKLFCQDVKVYVTNNCIYEITPAEILGECFPFFQGYVIVYDGVNMTPVRGGVINRLGIFPYSLFNSKGGLVCLGQVFVSDTIGPVFKDDVAKRDWESRDTLILSENDIPSVLNNNLNWSQSDSPLFLGLPIVKDGCSPNFISRNVKDELISFPCDTIIKFKNGSVYSHLISKIKRTFTFTDNSNNATVFVQEIFFRKIGNPSSCDVTPPLAYDYAPPSLYSFGPLGDNPRIKIHPNFPLGKIDQNTTFYKCEAPDDVRFDVCSISDSMELDRLVKSVYSAFYTWPNGFKDTVSLFDKQNLWNVSYKSRVYSACNDGKRVRIIVTIEDICQKKIITDTLWIYFSRTSGPSFPALTGSGQNSVLGRDAAKPVFIQLPGNVCKSNILLPFTHGTDERDLGKWFNWTVKDDCTPRANLLLSYQVESKVISVSGKFKSSSAWNKVNYPLVHTPLGSSINDLPAGAHRIIVAATAGECEAISYDTLYFVLQDQVFPRVRCKPSVKVPLLYSANSDWYTNGRTNKVSARIRTDMVNNGSTDNCSLDTLYLRRVVSSACISDNFLGNLDYDKYGNKDGKVTIADFERINVGRNAGLYYTPRFLPYIEYFCCDVGKENVAELWASDIGFGNLSNNSYCEFQVVLQDVMNPVVFSPNLNQDPNRNAKNWVSCTDTAALNALKNEFKSNELFGQPTIYGLDCTGKVNYSTVDYVKCGSGHITRHWLVEKLVDNQTVTVRDSQIILVRPSHAFIINIPPDTTAFCGSNPAFSVSASSNDCDLLAISFVDSLSNEQENGISIQRTYTLINWCDVPSDAICKDITSNPSTFARTIPRKLNTTGKAMPFFHALEKLNAEKDRLLDDSTLVKFDSTRMMSGSTISTLRPVSLKDYPKNNSLTCDNDQVFAWKYTQIINLIDTIKPVVIVPDSSLVIQTNGSCSSTMSLTVKVLENCPFSKVSLDSIVLYEKNTKIRIPWGGKIDEGVYKNGFLTTRVNAIQPGNYDLWLEVSNHLRQKSSAVLAISVVPSSLQSLDCVQKLTINLTPPSSGEGGLVKINAMDVLNDKNLVSNLSTCYPGSFLSLKKVSDLSVSYIPNKKDSVLSFDCSSLKNTPIPLRVFLTDSKGISVSCDVSLYLSDSLNTCSPKVKITGAIKTATGKPVNQVTLGLSGFTSTSGQTNENGLFSIQNISTGGPYILNPVSPNDFKNGVSTLDLVLLQRQLIQGQTLKSPLQLLAADIDNSGTISIRDLLELRKLVINLTPKFEKNTSWRFIPTHFIFPDSSNPWKTPFPEEINFPVIFKDTTASFTAVKIGDLSGDAPLNQVPGVQFRREVSPWHLFYSVTENPTNREFLVSFFFNEKNKPDGFQSTIQWNPRFLNNVSFIPGSLTADYVNIEAERGLLNVSAEKLTDDGVLFSLLFSADNPSFNDPYLANNVLSPEAYKESQIFPLNLVKLPLEKEMFRVYPAVPNPFSGETVISFYLPQSSFTEMVISDLSGRILKKLSGQGMKGLNNWTLNLSELTSDLILFCKVKAGNDEGFQQIIKIK
ncbi:MAG: hypothetical protein KGQ50_04010 [Bacteroidetes bacterium]|nr:hypothetical protein [Bacteroidota bacterium]